jgi:phosphoglycerate dehydrogenase-like enzyme
MHEWRARQFFPKDEEKIRPRCVNQLTIGILGYGNMGKSIAKLFKVSLIFFYPVHDMSTTNFDS